MVQILPHTQSARWPPLPTWCWGVQERHDGKCFGNLNFCSLLFWFKLPVTSTKEEEKNKAFWTQQHSGQQEVRQIKLCLPKGHTERGCQSWCKEEQATVKLQVNSKKQPVACKGVWCNSVHHQLNYKLHAWPAALTAWAQGGLPALPEIPSTQLSCLLDTSSSSCRLKTDLPWVRGHFLSLPNLAKHPELTSR